MSEHTVNPGAGPRDNKAEKAAADADAARAKAEAAKAKKEAKHLAEEAKHEAEKAEDEAHEKRVAEGEADEEQEPSKPKVEEDEEPEEEPEEAPAGPSLPKQKPELDEAAQDALAARDAKQRSNPAFRRHEWFRYKKLGGKDAPWRRPRGIHSKQRRHYKYRPPVVSIGYRTPTAARGLHPSGFEEVLVHRPADLEDLDPKTQAARVGGTVGGRKQAAIVAKADDMGIRVLNRGGN